MIPYEGTVVREGVRLQETFGKADSAPSKQNRPSKI